MSRRVTISTPLGEALQFRQLNGREAISELFEFDIELISDSKTLSPKAVLGQTATLTIETQGQGQRFLNGIVTQFGMHGHELRFAAYHLKLRPWLWLGTRRADFRIFQNQSVPDIVSAVLGPYGHPLLPRLTRAYRRWDYCVQYNETDTHFVCRLLEHEGISFHFEHSPGQHTLVLSDDTLGSHSALPGYASVPYYPPDKAALAPEECFSSWALAQQIRPGRHYNDDYDFKKPRADLSNMRQMPPGHANDKHEIYEWPGGFTEFADGETYVRVRAEEHQAWVQQVRGSSDVRGLAPGYLMSLSNYPREDQNQQYLITAVNYHFAENTQVSDSTQGSVQRLDMEAIPASVSYRPERITPKPRTTGPQTAVVVGPPGEEIWTDQYGRIKVQFFWDRLGRFDHNSSCWLRVSAPWAGSNFGGIFIPRIGQEVIVDFLNGDPDHPLVTGCVYNADQMPPWGLPGNATQSGVKTRSSPGGAPGAGLGAGAGDANLIQFEDKAGAELLTVHAQKDQLTEVEHDESKWVGNDRKKAIDRDETTVVGRDRTETVKRDETITVHGQRTETVDGNESITIHSARQERVDQTEAISIGQSRTETVGTSESVSIGSSQSLSVGSTRSKTVGSSESDRIGTRWRIDVGTMKNETVGIGYTQSTGVFKMVNIGVAYNLNVGMVLLSNVGLQRIDTVGMDWSRSAGANETVSVGAGQTITVGAAQATTVGGEHSLKVGSDSRTEAGQVLALKAGTQVQVDGQDITLTAQSSLKLICGGSTLEMSPGLIKIVSGQVLINP
jgi:type VI secretion system secreted protein VgrG